MQASPSKQAAASSNAGAKLEILFGGPLLFVPNVEKGIVRSLDVFVPKNGHPMGSVFLPGVWFTPEELNSPECPRWPEPSSFSLLDPHSYFVAIEQDQRINTKPFLIRQIPSTNHKVEPGRRLKEDWEMVVSVSGKLSGWESYRLSKVTEGAYVGADAPAPGSITSALHKLTYENVEGAEFYGASTNPRTYFHEHAYEGGSLIVLGEVPYQPTLAHERLAIDAIARLAGLDLYLADTSPETHKTRLMDHVINCGHSIIVVPGT